MNNTRKSKDQLVQELNAAQRKIDVETALERVRGKALAMKGRDDLRDVADAIVAEFETLGIPALRSTITVFEGETNANWMALGKASASAGTCFFRFPTDASSSEISGLLEARKAGQPFHHFEVVGEDVRKRFEEGFRILRDLDMPDTVYFDNYVALTLTDHEQHYTLFFPQGHIRLVTEHPISETDVEMTLRFAHLFEFAYNRFLELKEKEDQNRELIIQNALERVRAQALGMQVSEDIFSVSAVLHEQMASLGIQAIVTSIEVVDREKGVFQNVGMIDSGEGFQWHTMPLESFRMIPAHARFLEAYDRGDITFTIQLKGEECRAFQNFWVGIMHAALSRW